MYQENKRNPNRGLYQHYMICSPDVLVIRDTDGNLIDPYPITFLTVPAVNAGDARKKGVSDDVINATMHSRMDRMFAMAVQHNVKVLILGSWGCGVFGGDINSVAQMFIDLLTTTYVGVFKQVVFATLDKKHKKVFERVLDAKFGRE